MTYLNVPAQSSVEYLYGTKETIKDLGGSWDSNYSMWTLPIDVEVPTDMESYIWETTNG